MVNTNSDGQHKQWWSTQTVMVNTNQQVNNHLSPQIIEHKKDHDICCL